ncbi:MAG: ribosomal RNA small subunit methyltransferase A [Candidatus Dadabacteria bacterium]|nr:MAG: ribosomal RNA small subunit methyltransferase A [Candidatus Dadabacteria bacterium]
MYRQRGHDCAGRDGLLAPSRSRSARLSAAQSLGGRHMVARAKKSLGQHFLVDGGVIEQILGAVPAQPEPILEIGPGRGALTERLREQQRPLVLVEKDADLATQWRARGIETLEADAADPAWLDALPDRQFTVVSNLPYNAATAIVRVLLSRWPRFPVMVLMFQREVAQRFSEAGSRLGGPLGVLAALVYRVRTVLDVPPGAFSPPPKVQSRVLRFDVREDAAPPEDLDPAWRLLLQLFQRRRARLDRALANAVGRSRGEVQAWFRECGLREDARPDHLSPEQFRVLFHRSRAA